MSLLTVLLLLILLILLFDLSFQKKEGYTTTANDFRTAQYIINEEQLNSTVNAIHQNKNLNDEIDRDIISKTKSLNDHICSSAIFYDYENIDDQSISYNKGMIVKPKKITGFSKAGSQYSVIGINDIYSKCQANIHLSDEVNCSNLSAKNNLFRSCFDFNGSNIDLGEGEIVKDENGHEMCKFSKCANKCAVQSRYCYTSNNTDGFIRENIFMDKCDFPIQNNCVLLDPNNEYFKNEIIDLCPYKTYYYVYDSNGTNNARDLQFYDKSVELLEDGTTYKCLYNIQEEHEPNNTFDSLSDMLNICSLSNFQSNLQCYSHVENQTYVYNKDYPYDQIKCKYYPKEPCFFPMTDKNNSNILCEYNSYDSASKDCMLPISCTKSRYTAYSEKHIGSTKTDTYDRHIIHGNLQEEIIDGNRYLSCVYDDSVTFATNTENFIAEPQYFDNITCSNLRCGQGIINDLPNGQVQCVFHDCPSDDLIHTNNKLSKSLNRLSKLQASKKVAENKIDEFQKLQDAINKDKQYIKKQQYMLNDQEEQLSDKIIRNSSRLDAFKSIDTTLRRKINNTSKYINNLKNSINKQTYIYEETPIVEAFSSEDNFQASIHQAELAIKERQKQADLERQQQENLKIKQQIASLNEQTKILSHNQEIKNDRIQEEQINEQLTKTHQQLDNLLPHEQWATIENISINQYNQSEVIKNKVDKLRQELSEIEEEYEVILDAEKKKIEYRNNDVMFNELVLSNLLTTINNEDNTLKNGLVTLTKCNKDLNPKDFLQCVMQYLKTTKTRIAEVERENEIAAKAVIDANTKVVTTKATIEAKANAIATELATVKASAAKVAAELVATKAAVEKAAAEKAAAEKVAAAKVAAAKVAAEKAAAEKIAAEKIAAAKVAAAEKAAAEKQNLNTTTKSILFPISTNEYNIKREIKYNNRMFSYYLGRKCEKNLTANSLVKNTFGSPVEGTQEYLPNNDIAVFDANFKGIKLNTNQHPGQQIGDKFSFHHKENNKYAIKNEVIHKWIKNSTNRISYREGASLKFYEPSINYVDTETDATVYDIELIDANKFKINFGHGGEKYVYFIEDADTTVEYDRGYYTCNKKYETSGTPLAESTDLLYTIGKSIRDKVNCETNTNPVILPDYPVITRISNEKAIVNIAFQCGVKLDWIIVPSKDNCVIDTIDKFRRLYQSHTIALRDHGIPNCELKHFGSTNLNQTVEYNLTFNNLLQNEQYKLYLKPIRQLNNTESFFAFNIPFEVSSINETVSTSMDTITPEMIKVCADNRSLEPLTLHNVNSFPLTIMFGNSNKTINITKLEATKIENSIKISYTTSELIIIRWVIVPIESDKMNYFIEHQCNIIPASPWLLSESFGTKRLYKEGSFTIYNVAQTSYNLYFTCMSINAESNFMIYKLNIP